MEICSVCFQENRNTGTKRVYRHMRGKKCLHNSWNA